MPEGSAKPLWEKVYNESKKSGDSEEVAARKAWAAVKNAGWKKNDAGEWVKGKSEVQEFSLAIVKAAWDKENQVMRWRAVASDTSADLYDERMSLELFNDFVGRIKSKAPVPEPFNEIICEESWCGGIPYLSVAHYKSGSGGKNLPGSVDEDGIYVDGTRLKAKGVLYDNPLGVATFKSLCEDLYTKRNESEHQPVRISIGFLDLQHKHLAESGGQEYIFTRTDVGQNCPLCAQGIGNKIYTKGQLVHLAMTRVPVNPRTAMEVDKSMDGIITKKDDAKSIIGDLAEGLEEKSQADEVLVIKADGTTNQPDDDKYDACYDPNTDSFNQECLDNLLKANSVDMRDGMEAVKSDVRKRALAKALTKLESTYKSHGLAWPMDAKPVVEESMELGGKTVDEKKFEYEGVHGDPRQDAKKEPMKAKVAEKETPEEDAKETEKDEKAEGKKMKALNAAFDAFKSKVATSDLTPEEVNAAFAEFGHGVENALTPEPTPLDPTQLSEIVKSAVESAVAPLRMELAQLKAQQPVQKSGVIPQPRSLQLKPMDLLQKSAPQAPQQKQRSQIERIARSSVGLNE